MSNKPVVRTPVDKRLARAQMLERAALLYLFFFITVAYAVAFHTGHPALMAALGVFGLIQTIRAALGLDPFRWWKN